MRFFVAEGAPQNDGGLVVRMARRGRWQSHRWIDFWRGPLSKSGGRAAALQKFSADR
jgi:hypothetical protein